LTAAEVLRAGDGRVARNREDGVAVRAVIEYPAAAAEDEPLVAGEVVRRAETRADNDIRPRVAGLGDAVSGCPDPVIQIPDARDRRADGRLRVRQARNREDLLGNGVVGVANAIDQR